MQRAAAIKSATSSPGDWRFYLTGIGQIVLRPALSPSIQALVNKSELLLGEPKRIRNLEHLRCVASMPCLICGRQPSQAHHLRFTQPRALGKKVGDEFTAPLSAFHHDEVQRAGAEIKWWQARRIGPVAVARDLWASARNVETAQTKAAEPDRLDDRTLHDP